MQQIVSITLTNTRQGQNYRIHISIKQQSSEELSDVCRLVAGQPTEERKFDPYGPVTRRRCTMTGCPCSLCLE